MRKQLFFLFYVLIAFYQTSFAVKAYPYPVEITQPDGTKLTIILKGDERVKWAQTVDGYSIMRNSKGAYEYATINSDNDMVPSGILAKNKAERNSSDIKFLSNVKKELLYSKNQVGMMKSISNMVQKSSQKSFPTIGSRKLVCILMNFQDVKFSKSQSDFNNLFNQVGYTTDGAAGSVKDYYAENSYNQLDLTVTVAGPYTAAYNMAYYGANDANDNDVKPRELVNEAVNKANADVNYADFDNDNNGYVDGVYLIYAGYGEESGASADAIWAHAWEIAPVTLDGKIITSYSCSSELRGATGTGITRIGVICHEFGHLMGASDFYDTDYDDNGQFDGTGSWDIMADGSWNNDGASPAHHNPYTKIYKYGWASATTISSVASITLNNAEQNSNSFYRVNTATSNEYFLIENRQQQLFDSNIPGHGMIIYHVDGNYISNHEDAGEINIGEHQGLYPVCASATTNPGNTASTYGEINSASCPFPGNYLKTSFNDYTTPNSRSWAGANTYKSLSGITENIVVKTVSFNVSITARFNELKGETITSYLAQNYPNPFDQTTTIDFKIVKPSHVSLSVFNALGQKVDVIVDEYLPADNYSKQWTPKGIPAGIYFYQLTIDGYKETKRLIKK